MIRLEHVTCEYEKSRPVLDGLSFTVRKGESVGLIGANGAGKSTLLMALLGFLPYAGSITVGGLPVEKRNLKEIRGKAGLVLQDSDHQMFMPTVWEDILFGPLNYGMSREEAAGKADEALERLHLSGLKHRHNHKLSGGEKRMAAIATVLAMEPEIILMDEPTAALDPCNRRTVIRAVNSLSQTKLIASHDLDMILETCGRVILLSEGKIAADGETARILADQELLEAHRLELPFCMQGFAGNIIPKSRE